jgi:tetratricopeptide (TPR) repeat protein
VSAGRATGPARVSRRPAADERHWHLRDERDFLRRSLADAAREHDAGDLSDEDHALLVARDETRLAEVEAELAAAAAARAGGSPHDPGAAGNHEGAPGAPGAPVPEARRPMPAWRKVGIVASCALIVAGIGLLAAHAVQSRTPGQPLSGSISLSQAQRIEQQLQQALVLNNQGDTKGALELYDQVLSEDPSNPAALAYAGYLQWTIGSSAHVASLVRVGRSMIETAVHESPAYYEAHLFDGLVLENQDHDAAAAVVQFGDYLADGPPAGDAAKVAPLVAPAYQAAGVPLPAAFSGSSGSRGPAPATSG